MKLQDIDFRIWNRLRGHYVKDHPYENEEGSRSEINFCIAQGKVLVVDDECEVVDIIIDCDVEFFTGFKDKNLTKIYEGDIVRFGKDEEIYRFVISFKNGCFNAIDEKECNIMPITLFEHSENYTILGNIHENPELLDWKNGKEMTKRS